MAELQQHNILYSCVEEHKKVQDVLVSEHILSLIVSGTVQAYTEKGVETFGAGTLCLSKRHQLIKAGKKTDGKTPFKGININLNQVILKNYSIEHKIKASKTYTDEPNIWLPLDPFMKGYFDSLMPYFDNPEELTPTLAKIKTTEVISLLLRNPALINFLFDFSEPFKIDLENFMNRHFTNNVPLADFAKLTGRSLSTFKRDFEKTFSQTPKKWLKEQRLEKAHFLIAEKKQKPSDVYLQVGFENLSHFSASFKGKYGYNASSL